MGLNTSKGLLSAAAGDNFARVKAVPLQDALHKPKFKPSDVVLDSGRSVRVKHPDCVLFNESRTIAVCHCDAESC
jgi:hypothetical protein